MRKTTFVLAFAALVIGFAAGAAAEEDYYLVVFNKNNVPAKALATIEAVGGTVVTTLPEIGVAVAVSSDPGFAQAAKTIKGVIEAGPAGYNLLPDIEAQAVEPVNGPADAVFFDAYQWDIRRVNAPAAWDAGYTGSHGTVVAILDTGIAFNHPDLGPNVVWADCFNSLGRWSDGVCNLYPDVSWHGTHVAGTVAGFGTYMAGVGPDLGLASYKIFEDVNGSYVAYTFVRWQAMIDVANQGFDVINLSLGGLVGFGGGNSSELAAYRATEKRVANYMKQHGVTVVASAGNDGVNTNGPLFHFPGDVAGYINVGATVILPAPIYPFEGSYDVRALYSNYGAALSVVAPGGDWVEGTEYDPWLFMVFSTYVYINPVCAASWNCNLGVAWASGTSMAAPHVAGVAGLVKDNSPWLNTNQVAAIITSTAEDMGDRQQFGHGMVDTYAAVTK